MSELFDAYANTRSRMLAVAQNVGPQALQANVPACPDWSAHQLLSHCVSMPAALSAGDFPTGDPNEWIDGLVSRYQDKSLDELAEVWSSVDETIAGMLDGGGGMLFDDLAVHEHDLRAAVQQPDHSALETAVLLPRVVASCTDALIAQGLGSIEVRSGSQSWRSHDAEPGWILELSPWEATRAIYSRRTAEELRSLGAGPDQERCIELLDAHLPLPVSSLNE